MYLVRHKRFQVFHSNFEPNGYNRFEVWIWNQSYLNPSIQFQMQHKGIGWRSRAKHWNRQNFKIFQYWNYPTTKAILKHKATWSSTKQDMVQRTKWKSKKKTATAVKP